MQIQDHSSYYYYYYYVLEVKGSNFEEIALFTKDSD